MADEFIPSSEYYAAPALKPEVRSQMLDALYNGVYAQALPRSEFDKQIGAKSDLDIANAAYDSFYKDKLSRPDFNTQVGFRSASGSTTQALTSGATLGLSDEVSGAVSGAASWLRGEGFQSGYDRTTKAMRQNAEVFRQNNPYLGRAIEFLGGLGIGGAASGAKTSAELLSLPNLMKQGATIGGVSGFGDAEGGLTNRAIGAAEGAAIGAGAPVAVAGITRAATPVARSAANLMGLGSADVAAERQVGRAMADANVTTNDLARALSDLPSDKPVVLADVIGQPGRQLAATVANRPGPGTQIADALVEARRAGRPDRIAADIDRTVGKGSGSAVADTTEELLSSRARNAAPLYEQAFSQPAGMTGRLQEFLNDPIAKQGLARGLRIQELENLSRPAEARMATVDKAIQYAEDGTPRIVDVPNMRTLDAVKRGLDDMLETYRGPDGRLHLDQMGRAIEGVRKSYVTELSKNNEAYAAARAVWAGPSESLDAIAMGRRIVTADRDIVARQLADMSPSEREFFRIGIARALTDRTADPSRSGEFVRRMMEDRNLRAKLEGVFDTPEQFQQFAKRMQAELMMRDTDKAISPRAGSQTARLVMGNADLADAPAGGLVAELLRVGSTGGRPTIAAAQRLYQRGQVGTPAMAGAIAPMLMSTDRNAIGQALSRLQSRQVADTFDAHQRAQIIRALLGGASAATPQQLN